MTVRIIDLADEGNDVSLGQRHYERLIYRGVFMPAGVFCVDPEVRRVYLSDRFDERASLEGFTAPEAAARGCAMAMRAYADAVRYGSKYKRAWVDDVDRGLLDLEEAIVRTLMTCRGFRVL